MTASHRPFSRPGRSLVVALLLGFGLALAPAPRFVSVAHAETERRAPVIEADADVPQPTEEAAPAPSALVTQRRPSTPEPPTDAPRARAAEVGIAEFEMLGVELPEAAGDVLVRTHGPDGWTEWTSLHMDDGHGPDRGTDEQERASGRAFSEPLWVGSADGYELSLPGDAAGVGVHLVREETETVVAASTPAGAQAAPSIRPRSAWGARAPKVTPFVAGDFRLAIVHHSASANGYSQGEVPSIIRGIQAFHMDSRGWDDIAYNFVVDRFGVVWEGRAGGVDKAVVGGHAAGFNTFSTGVVALGDFTSAAPPAAVTTSISQLLSWKFAIHRLNPNGWTDYKTAGSSSHAAGTYRLPRIITHRDVGQTSCPGSQLYSRLSSIRSATYAGFGGHLAARPALPITGDFDGDGTSDTMYYRPGSSPDTIWYGQRAGGFRRVSMSVAGVYRPLAADFNGDGVSDILWHGPGSDLDSVMYGQRGGGFAKRDMDIPSSHVPFTGDFNGDRIDDLFWYGPGLGPDKLYYGTRSSTFLGKDVAVDTTFTPIVGDFNADGRSDLLWYTPNTGPDRLWYGRPALGEWGRPSTSPTINDPYQPVVADYDADGFDDIFWFGTGSAADSFWSGARTEGSFRIQAVNATTGGVATAFDGAGDGAADLLWYSPGRPGDPYWRIGPGGAVFARHTLMINGHYLQASGDYNGDGRDDLMWWTPNGQTHVWYGRLDGDFTRVQVG